MYLPDHNSAFAPEAARPTVPAQLAPAKVEAANTNRMTRVLARIGAWYVAWRNRRAVAGLLGLDEYLLRDIGLTRSDVSGALAVRATEDPSERLRSAADSRRAGRRSLAAFHNPAVLEPPAARRADLHGELF